MFAGVSEGYRAILRNRNLRLIVMLYIAQTVVAGCSVVYEVTIALELLDMHDSGVGVLNAALGVGGLVGGVVALGVVATRKARARLRIRRRSVGGSVAARRHLAHRRVSARRDGVDRHRQLARRRQCRNDRPTTRSRRGARARLRRARQCSDRRHGDRCGDDARAHHDDRIAGRTGGDRGRGDDPRARRAARPRRGSTTRRSHPRRSICFRACRCSPCCPNT